MTPLSHRIYSGKLKHSEIPTLIDRLEQSHARLLNAAVAYLKNPRYFDQLEDAILIAEQIK